MSLLKQDFVNSILIPIQTLIIERNHVKKLWIFTIFAIIESF